MDSTAPNSTERVTSAHACLGRARIPSGADSDTGAHMLLGPIDPSARYKGRAISCVACRTTISFLCRTMFRSIGRADQKVNVVGPSTARFICSNFYKHDFRMARFVLSSKDSSEEIPRGKFNVDRLAAVVPPPRIHCHRYFRVCANGRSSGIFAATPNGRNWPVSDRHVQLK